MQKAFATGTVTHFLNQLSWRLQQFKQELAADRCVMPAGIFFVIDEAHGGDATAKELVQRFHLLDRESKNVVDFYFVGWKKGIEGLVFDLDRFESFRDALSRLGVEQFGGNADLILVDAEILPEGCQLRFDRSIRLDLSKGVKTGDFPVLGEFLQAIIRAAKEVQTTVTETRQGSPVFHISDEMGLIFAKQSLLDFILDKWGKFFGAKRLAALATRKVGPMISFEELERTEYS